MMAPIYLDYNSTTPVDPRVLEKMLPYFAQEFGNAASIDHLHGNAAAGAVEQAREEIARSIGAKSDEVIFTSGATESNNLALLGAARANASRGKHIISCVTEHPAVLDVLAYLQTEGFEVTLLPVSRDGLLNPEEVRSAIRSDTILVSIMAANNEIGTLASLGRIGEIARAHGAVFHTDATQALSAVEIDVDRDKIDLLSLSAHKCYGPKGIGALFVRARNPRIKLTPVFHGGGHERGFRSGTLNVPGIVGLGEALRLARQSMKRENVRLSNLRGELLRRLQETCPDLTVNGSLDQRLPGNLNVWLPGVENRALIRLVADQVSISAGSACTTTKVTPSHVLLAIGLAEEQAHQSIRLSSGRFTALADIETAATALDKGIKRIRSLQGALAPQGR